MTSINWIPIQRLAAGVALVLSSLSIGMGSAQAADCDPGASGALPVVNTGLPVVQIWTTARAPILDRETYISACMRIKDGSAQPYGQGLFNGTTVKVRGRGNSTWDMPKRGVRIKLDVAAPVLDMPSHKDWVLLANYADKTLLRNAVGMEFSRRVGMAWTPRLRHVDVYLNDEFLGNYQLGEKVEVAPNRVNITPMTTADIALPNVSGGWLIEADFLEYMGTGDKYFDTASGIHFVMQSPSGTSLQPAQVAYISQYTQALENAILARNDQPGTGYPSLIDVNSLINWYIVEELLKNVDSPFRSSVNIYKDRNGPMKMGPLWDFDLAAGNVDYSADAMVPTGWYIRSRSDWIGALVQDKNFRNRVKTRWNEVKSQLQSIDGYIDAMESRLQRSQAANFTRWPILNEWVWPNAVVLGSHHAEVAYLKDWLAQRISWMDRNIGK